MVSLRGVWAGRGLGAKRGLTGDNVRFSSQVAIHELCLHGAGWVCFLRAGRAWWTHRPWWARGTIQGRWWCRRERSQCSSFNRWSESVQESAGTAPREGNIIQSNQPTPLLSASRHTQTFYMEMYDVPSCISAPLLEFEVIWGSTTFPFCFSRVLGSPETLAKTLPFLSYAQTLRIPPTMFLVHCRWSVSVERIALCIPLISNGTVGLPCTYFCFHLCPYYFPCLEFSATLQLPLLLPIPRDASRLNSGLFLLQEASL